MPCSFGNPSQGSSGSAQTLFSDIMCFPSNPWVQKFLRFQRRPGSLAAYWNYSVQSPFQLVVSLIGWEEEDGMLKSMLLSFLTQNSSPPNASGVGWTWVFLFFHQQEAFLPEKKKKSFVLPLQSESSVVSPLPPPLYLTSMASRPLSGRCCGCSTVQAKRGVYLPGQSLFCSHP